MLAFIQKLRMPSFLRFLFPAPSLAPAPVLAPSHLPAQFWPINLYVPQILKERLGHLETWSDFLGLVPVKRTSARMQCNFTTHGRGLLQAPNELSAGCLEGLVKFNAMQAVCPNGVGYQRWGSHIPGSR